MSDELSPKDIPLIPGFQPEYLGNNVYVRFDGFGFVLYLDNSEDPHTQIYLEPDVYQSLTNYADKVAETIKALKG